MKVMWTESAYGHGKVDKKSGVIHDVKILGLQSRNGRRYLPEEKETYVTDGGFLRMFESTATASCGAT
jgi:hypothetical protein